MSFDTIVYLVSALFTIAIVYGLIRFILHSKKDGKIMKRIAIIVVIIVSLPLWYFLCIPVMGTIANLMPADKPVPCFLLNEKNCKAHLNCIANYLPAMPGGLGVRNSNFMCGEKNYPIDF